MAVTCNHAFEPLPFYIGVFKREPPHYKYPDQPNFECCSLCGVLRIKPDEPKRSSANQP